MKNLEKEFVPYKESLELKELGFNEPCLFGFDNCSTPMRCSDLRTNDQKFNGVNYNSSTYTSQPTFSQAFRWFREKHGLSAQFSYYYVPKWTFEILEFTDMKITPNKVVSEHSKERTYEEAELACLRKLIEIVKNK